MSQANGKCRDCSPNPVDRRDFIKSATAISLATASAGILTGIPAVARAAEAATSETLVQQLYGTYLIEVDVTDRLASIEVPTLIMVGDQDVLTPAVQGETGCGGRQIFDGLTACKIKEFLLLEGSAHSNMRDVPDVCAKAIVDFVDRVLGKA